ncbi:sugar ABC transporter ATP-binding protein [Lichenifustis flavocetrariae]|uniref:Sugar ABC transporter ATP-binding protein n=1 Tax=Lichenifustis flavocetrariae TaxID=2949735 RepID=A0AA41YQY5_9HYPH|nr:sugar ABC transporter ATP-binding protein [Lichenifustis flavocetrariae]MCW6506921.1 sugar ABC transporter ATP-binding protein [Lichenifustis flavocetrariae]
MSEPQPSAPAIAAKNIRKVFGATIAVNDVSFAVEAGEVHALLGENGAGKSTLVKLLSGLILPTTGVLSVFGMPAVLDAPRASHARGIQTAFQELTMVRDLTVLDNMLMPYPPINAFGQIRRGEARRRVEAHLDALGLGDIDPQAELRDLDLNQRQKIEIARALFRQPKILLLDEPTSTLSGRDIDWLGDLIEKRRGAGVTIVFISHRMREVRAFCDRVTVLRNGRHVATERLSDVSDEAVIDMIAGKALGQSFPPKPPVPSPSGEPVLGVRNLATEKRLADVSFDLRRGEILGVAGLQGMGQLELFTALFGMEESTGDIRVEGRPVTFTSPRDAADARIGISLVPEDRKTEALFLKLDGKRNVSLPVIDRYTRFGLIDGAREEADVSLVLARLNVQMRALWTGVKAFSGGNQQKIAIAKWLFAQSRVLLLFDPTRGIDVGTKHEIYALMQEYAAAGGAILFYSTEIAELDHLAHRVLVLYRGRIAADLAGGEISEDAILRATLGGAPASLELQ